MTPVFLDDPAPHYRRGRTLTLYVVLGTAGLFLWSAVESNLLKSMGGSLHLTIPKEVLSPAVTAILGRGLGLCLDAFFIFLLCRFAYRGGGTSTGCLTILYSASMLGVTIVLLLLLLSLTHLVSLGSDLKMNDILFKDVGRNPKSTLAFSLYAAWTGFAFWVLVYSADARYYRRTRQRGILPPDAPPSPPSQQ